MSSPSSKIQKELARFKKRLFKSTPESNEVEQLRYAVENLPYEIQDKLQRGELCLPVPRIMNAGDTARKIIRDKCSLARFGDGEFNLMRDSRIHFQNPSPRLSQRLKDVIASDNPGLLIALPDCFGSLDEYEPHVADFWRKWLARKRTTTYAHLDMERVYYSAFFTRAYMPYVKSGEHYNRCRDYFTTVKQIWAGRDVIICEGEGTRFGMFNDLLSGAKSISRILCPARNAFSKYDEILSACDDLNKDSLVLAALGPTATVLAFDLAGKGLQTIDIGHLDVEYEWFLRKDETGQPLEFKYVDGSDAGRKVHRLDNAEYDTQIIGKVL